MSERAAFIDVGTNSIHMIVVDFDGGSMGTTVFQDKETIRMGRGLYENGVLDKDTLQKAYLVLSKFASIAKEHGAGEIVAMATCAAREAPNRSELIEAARRCGLELRVIPGREEARLIRLGVLGPECARPTVCIDVGGGSTEIILADGKEDLYLDSLNLGAIRMAYGSGVDQQGRVTLQKYAELKRLVDAQCYRSVNALRDFGFEEAVGSSGTVEALADACAARRGDGDSSYFTHAELRSLMKQMCSMTAGERAQLPKISASRAEIAVGGGVIVDELMELLGIERLTVSRSGLREGMKIDYMMRHGHPGVGLRPASVAALAARCGCTTDHEKAVERYSSMLYAEFVHAGIIPESKDMEELLGYAAKLHDAGVFISYDRHNIHSYIIIRNSYLAGFDSEELERMALMVRMHHGSFPGADSRLFAEMDADEALTVRRYAMILKMADVLDRCRDNSIDDVSVEILNGNVNIVISSETDISMVMWKLKAMEVDFESVFGYRLHAVENRL